MSSSLYANGVFGTRRIERATYRDLAVRYLCADTHPDHDTICKFRREDFEAVSEAFLQVLLLARELKLLQVGAISVDGTKVDANASKHRNVRYERAGELIEQLEADIAALMRKNKGGEYRQSYNGQAAVNTDGGQLIVGVHLTDAASDRRELVAVVDAVPPELGRIGSVLADSGYASGEEVDELGHRSGEVLVAVGREGRRRYDFRPEVPEKAPPKRSQPWVVRMKERLSTPRCRKKYRLRKQTVEPVFGILKEARGFRRFLLRGLEKVRGEWNLVCLAYNCRRLHRLITAM